MSETPDIVERLRDPNAYGNVPICREAARTIELLRAEVGAWRTASFNDYLIWTNYTIDGAEQLRAFREAKSGLTEAIAATDAAGALGRKP